MKRTICSGLLYVLLTPATVNAQAQAPPNVVTEEFGLSPRELVQAIENAEELIARCMPDQGFEYVAADYNTVRAGMSADQKAALRKLQDCQRAVSIKSFKLQEEIVTQVEERVQKELFARKVQWRQLQLRTPRSRSARLWGWWVWSPKSDGPHMTNQLM